MRQKPILVSFYFHWDDPIHREGTVRALRRVTAILAAHKVRAHYGFVGIVAQQLAQDSPETVEAIRSMRMAIGYHGGAGDMWGGPVGYPRDTHGLSWDGAIRAFWEFETHTLDRETQQPVPHRKGGWLAIQDVLGVTPLPTDARGKGRLDTPAEFVLARMGAAAYSVAYPYDTRAVILSPLHEPQLFPGQRGIPSTYYGQTPGQDAPMTADPIRWFDVLAHNLPDDTTFVVQCMSHAGGDWDRFERLVAFLAEHPDDFAVVSVDTEGAQWAAGNSPISFYRCSYGIESLEALMELADPPCPLAKTVSREEIVQIAAALLRQPSINSHDGDFGEPPDYVDIRTRRFSLAEAFQALARGLATYAQNGALPLQLTLPYLRGPIDYPRYRHSVEPHASTAPVPGYTPMEITCEEAPDPEIVNAQGLPPAGDYHIWMPTHTIAAGEAIIQAAGRLDLSDHIPGVIQIRILSEASRSGAEEHTRVTLNAAEFLYALAQEVRLVALSGCPGPVALVSTKISGAQLTRCVLVRPGGPRDSFLWRSDLSAEILDALWNRVPVPGQEQIAWASLPPLGGRLKALLGLRPVETGW
jgi:hypothetical protein